MINAELIRQTEARFSERQAIRQEKEAKIRAGAILEADTPDRVRKRIQHLATAAVVIEGFGIPAPGQPAAPTASALERILLKNDLMSINYLELGVRVARTVGRVHVRTADGEHAGYGTGFLISPRLILTNNHVLEDAGQAGASRMEFNFQEGPDGKLLSSIMFNLDPAAFFVTNQALDYSIVALKGDTRNIAKFGWNGLSAAEGKVIVGEYVTIIQHPSGQRKQIALRENQIVDVLENFLHYRTDTAPGSSGSPVFNDQWEVVSLHHSGVPRKDAQGRILTKDGKVWNRSIPDTQVDWIANEGVRISRLLKHLAGLSLSGSQAALRKQVLDSDKGWVGARSAAELIEGDERETTRTSSGWTLPLQLTIEVGDGASGAPEGGGAPRIQVRGPETPRNGDLGEGAGSAGQDELVSAWQAHESASRRPEPLPEAPQEAAAPARTESPLEWLTRTSGAAAEGRDQFAKEGALW